MGYVETEASMNANGKGTAAKWAVGASFGLVVGLAALGFVGFQLNVSDALKVDVDPFLAFCAPVPQAAIVPMNAAADHLIQVRVPAVAPVTAILDESSGNTAFIRRGDIVEFRVDSPQNAAIAVHGLSDLVRVMPGKQGIVRFKAIYSGRFSLHYHGLDQSHFEVAVLEVR